MSLLIFTFIFLTLGILAPKCIPDIKRKSYGDEDAIINMRWVRWGSSIMFIVLSIICFSLTSIVNVDQREVGHLKRIIGGDSMPQEQVIAAPWQNGAQARTLTPGFKFIPFIKVFYEIEYKPIVDVPEGSYGFLVANDGAPLRKGQYICDGWSEGSEQKMIDAEYFLGFDVGEDDYKGPRGQKGPQLTILPPGKYRVNRYLFDVKEGKSTNVPAGFVGVVKSNVGNIYKGKPILPTGIDASILSVPIVPKDYQGVWKDVLIPGRYYMNEKAYKITQIDTRVLTCKYLGGYTRRWIDLKIGENGQIEQTERTDVVPVPEDAADPSIVLRVEGWDVFQDSRVQIQVTPENAPFVVAAVGSIDAIEDKIITPSYRSIVRNVVAENVKEKITTIDSEGKEIIKTVMRPRKVLDLLYDREKLENLTYNELKPSAAAAGVTVQWVRFGDPVIPPELLIPGKRKQLADQLQTTYKEEQKAQMARVETEKERARADQQSELMKSQIGIQVAENEKMARTKRGEGEKAYLTSVAKGQEAQALVLGKEKAFELAYVKEILSAAAENPQLIKVPNTLVMGQGSSLEGAAAILGANNLTMGLQKGENNN